MTQANPQTTADNDRIKSETGERGWLSVEFSGFQASDEKSSLFRRWISSLTAIRSDGETFEVPVVHLQSDTPMKIGDDLVRSFDRLETYRQCGCITSTGNVCPLHREGL